MSPGSKLCTTLLNIAKHDKIMTKNHFTGTATQPHRNRKLCTLLDNDQYCTTWFWKAIYRIIHHKTWTGTYKTVKRFES